MNKLMAFFLVISFISITHTPFVSATQMDSTNFNLTIEVISSGGNNISSTNYSLSNAGVVGESIINISDSSHFMIYGGFLQGLIYAIGGTPSTTTGGTVSCPLCEILTPKITYEDIVTSTLFRSTCGGLLIVLLFGGVYYRKYRKERRRRRVRDKELLTIKRQVNQRSQ